MANAPRLSFRSQHILMLAGALLVVGCAPANTASASTASAVHYSGPIVIKKGGTYQGNWQSLDPDKPAVTISTSEPVIIENSNIQSRGTLILSAYVKANVTVRNTRGVALNPGRPASEKRSPGYFLQLEDFQSANIYNNEMVGTIGMYFRNFLGNPAKGQTIKILRNKALNIDGRFSDGPDRFSPTGWWGVHFVQFNGVKNVANAEIAWNEVINEPWKSRVEESINMYLSSGTPKSYIEIHDNYIQGAYPANPVTDKYGGGGIMLGDGYSRKVEGVSAYIRGFHNQVVGTSNMGMAIAAGHDIEAYENRVISSGLLPDGKKIASQNVGIYVWDQHGSTAIKTYFNNAMYDNLVGWSKPLQGPKAQNPFWFPSCATTNKGASLCTSNTVLSSPITRTMEEQEYRRWQDKLRAAKIVIGKK